MLKLGQVFNRQVARFNRAWEINSGGGISPNVPIEFRYLFEDATSNNLELRKNAFEQLSRYLTNRTPTADRGPLREKINKQLNDLSTQPEWPTFGMKSGISKGQPWLGPKMKDGAGQENFWGMVGSDNLDALSEGLGYLGTVEIEELLSSPALKKWRPPEGFWELPVSKQRPILERALREKTTAATIEVVNGEVRFLDPPDIRNLVNISFANGEKLLPAGTTVDMPLIPPAAEVRLSRVQRKS